MDEYCFKLFDKAYKLLSDVTPVRFDCGHLCSSRCCKDLYLSGAKQTGMALLPYEKEYLQSLGAKDFSYTDGIDSQILICGGKCDRKLRPFACRIFPYYADLKSGHIKIKPDMRAAAICPLLYSAGHFRRPSVYFIKNAVSAVRILSECPEIRNDFNKTSSFVDDITRLYTDIFGKHTVISGC